MEDMDTIFQPDLLTPGQFFGRLRSRQTTPELRLWFATFQAALEDLKDGGPNAGGNFRPAQKVLRRERAIAWLESPSEGIGSFNWMCGVLGLDPKAVRARVLEQGLSGKLERRA